MRSHRLNDFAACAVMWADPLVTRFIGGKPLSEEESWARLLRYRGHWALLGFGYWLVEDKDTGSFLGEVGFADLKREIEPAIKGVPELGWVFNSKFHGRGYATEAVGAALVWGASYLSATRTVCIVNPDNLVSIRVAHKCGFREYAQSTYKGGRILLFERDLA